ncbi:MAG: phenylalanine--tRNA ligase subunit beta [Pseudomonadota bacterium]|uniref:Phenylalanine--tRNA ligase beta subunit n=1 Tax=Candidatus Desulfatibia profunda TaxID=2841695 RepID=A0A8J6NW80_9BACT|nr:phenylalanine--tRNA ligase subunit beta [Candidatus Desulfatibia profunda]MBL7179613.1 phenylalanine--tRNA ligase subunit beta [Desulfobacterales bacterium]
MKVSVSWLKEYMDVDMPPSDLADALTMVGLEVDTFSDRYDYLDHVFVGRIAGIVPHANIDGLKICRVDLGNRTIPVVCGAPNVETGILAPCALPGACLPGGNVLKKGLIHGEGSEGMLCSEAELGLGAGGDGIMVLKQNLAVGKPLNKALGLSDPVFEIDLTPNRSDCLSIIGIAREIAALRKTRVNYPRISLPESCDDILNYTSVTILNPDLCPRYAARLVFDVAVGPSPFWLRDRLVSVGLKPINNIVDATNFVMMETGQPLHAFDFDRLAENRIVVRVAQEGETFTSLDQKERRLDSEMLMICDGEKSVAVGGVMGGLNSEVEETTTRVLLESAYFDPVCIRKTSKKLGLSTDASQRFERGVDPRGTIAALHRVARIIAEISGGKLVGGTIDENPKPFSEKMIDLSVTALNRYLGTRLNQDEIESYLRSIEFDVKKNDADKLRVFPPSYRVDISRFEDLTEEVARLLGYNNIKTTFPLIAADTRRTSKQIDSRNSIKRLMTGLGFTEVINYSFVSKRSCDRLELRSDDPRRKEIEILNPLSEDQAVMRTSLIPGLLETMRYNLAMQNRNLKLFEIGNVFFSTGEADSQPLEAEILAGLCTGIRNEALWFSKEVHCDFYDLKGVVEELLRNLRVDDTLFTGMPPEFCSYTKPGFTAEVFTANQSLGLIGKLHPNVLRNYELKQTAYIFELNVNQLSKHIAEIKSALPIPKFPATSRDITLIVDKNVEALKILKSVEALNEVLVENLHLFDAFEGDPIPLGKKSVSFRISYRSFHETLDDDTVNRIHQNIAERLLKEFNAILPA